MNILTDFLDQLHRWPVAVVCSLFGIVVGLIIKKSRVIENRWIPVGVVVTVTFFYWLTTGNGSISYDCPHPEAIIVMHGVLIGFVAWTVHKFILEKYLPKAVLAEWTNGDTALLKKEGVIPPVAGEPKP